MASSWSHITVRTADSLRNELDATYGNASATQSTGFRQCDLVSLDMSDPLRFTQAETAQLLEQANSAAQALDAIAGRS